MSVLDKAKTHWAALKRGTVHVPEWAGDEFDGIVHFDRLTVSDQQRMAPRLKSDPFGTGVQLVMTRAQDGGGKRLFDDEASTFAALLNEVSPQVLERIIAAMSSLPSEADAAKN